MDIPTQALTVMVADQSVYAKPKEFSTGSVGYYLTGKVQITEGPLAGERLQISGTAVVIGSKPSE